MLRLERAGRTVWKVPVNVLRVFIVVGCTGFGGLYGAEIISRLVGKPILFVEELLIYGIMWVYMAGAVFGTYERSHIMGGIVHLLFKSPRVRGGFKVVTTSISLVFCSLLSLWGYQLFMWDRSTTPETQLLFLPLEYARLSLFFAFTLAAVYFLAELIDVAHSLLRHSTSDS